MSGGAQTKPRASTEPQDGGWHKITDTLVDELILKGKLSPGGLELSLILIIQRHTWGKIGRPGWTKDLSLAKLAKMVSSGRGRDEGYTPRAVATAINRMLAAGIIAGKNAKGQPLRGSLTPEEKESAARSTAAAMYQSTPQCWKAAPKYVAPERVAADETAADETAADETAADETAADDPIVLMPGAKSKPMPLRLALKGREPVDIRWRAHNTSPASLSFFARPSADGLIFTVAEKGENKANDYVSRVPPQATRKPGELAAYLGETVPRYWGKVADAGFIVKVSKALNGAPVDALRLLVSQRLGANNPKKLQSGVLVNLAGDAARAYEATRAQREAQERASLIDEQAKGAEAAYWSRVEDQVPGGGHTPWWHIRNAVKQQIPDAAFVNWFARSRFVSIAERVLVVEVPDTETAAYIEVEYRDLVNRMILASPFVKADSVRFVARELARGAA